MHNTAFNALYTANYVKQFDKYKREFEQNGEQYTRQVLSSYSRWGRIWAFLCSDARYDAANQVLTRFST